MKLTFTRLKRKIRLMVWRMTHGIAAYVAVVAAYLFVAIMAGVYLQQRALYRDVEQWPSVPAHAVRKMSVSRFPSLVSNNPGFATPVHYVYTVNGAAHPRCRATPDSDSGNRYFGENPRAYYHPQHPEIAVLFPVPYQGTALIIALTCGAVVVVAHLCLRVVRKA